MNPKYFRIAVLGGLFMYLVWIGIGIPPECYAGLC